MTHIGASTAVGLLHTNLLVVPAAVFLIQMCCFCLCSDPSATRLCSLPQKCFWVNLKSGETVMYLSGLSARAFHALPAHECESSDFSKCSPSPSVGVRAPTFTGTCGEMCRCHWAFQVPLLHLVLHFGVGAQGVSCPFWSVGAGHCRWTQREFPAGIPGRGVLPASQRRSIWGGHVFQMGNEMKPVLQQPALLLPRCKGPLTES